ncbi:hypothetical protein [Microbacterium sp. TNHR37B]|uniref:hypothetical protein n=1 Tax=Microbacterium sp. TNHR37B TaxID=1775956 RepID=UPI0007B29F04|nr:hypothetical protein [Microbacterium sp. TNHR37B]KZE91482.1 hypothetical protein AVP41_01024 [Microbacterium sp. TNHR37B]
MSDDDTSLDPAQMFEVMQSTRRRTHSRLTRMYSTLLFVWAAAWLFGFGALMLGDGIGGAPVLPAPVAWTVFGSLIAAAIVWSIVAGLRSAASGISGRSQLQGALYGYSWMIAMIGGWLLLMGLQKSGLSPETTNLLYPALFVLLVGVLYLAGGALWRSPAQYVLGIALIAVVVVATFVGSPWHYLIYATAGPLAMSVVAVMLLGGIIPAEPRSGGDAA